MPLNLNTSAVDGLTHDIIEETANQLVTNGRPDLTGASPEEVRKHVGYTAETVEKNWENSRAVPPPIIGNRKLIAAKEDALTALSFKDKSLKTWRNWLEAPFDRKTGLENLDDRFRKSLPWDPATTVYLPGTSVRIEGKSTISTSPATGRERTSRTTGRNLRSTIRRNLGAVRERRRCPSTAAVNGSIKASSKKSPDCPIPDTTMKSSPCPSRMTGRRSWPDIPRTPASCSTMENLPGPDAGKFRCELTFALPVKANEKHHRTKWNSIYSDLFRISCL